MAYIEIETPEGTKRVQLERDHLSIGRLSYNDIVLPSAQISRQHAEIRHFNGQWQIADTHSTNGIQHNGVRIQQHMLSNGDKFLLAPGITITFYQEGAPVASTPAPSAGSNTSHPNWAQSFAQQPAPAAQHYASLPPAAQPQGFAHPFRATPSSPLYAAVSAVSPASAPSSATPVMPVPPATPVPPNAAPSSSTPFVPSNSVAPLGPRSVFADDEVRFVPASMAPSSFTPPPPPAPIEPPMRPPTPRQSMPPFAAGGASLTAQTPPSGYPAPLGPMTPGSDAHDLYHRSSAGPALQGRATSGPASKLLHVCQTCGQLTAPDSVYCQNCRHSIAQECFNCRLSLLPIQERCPRCHTPNAASVRRKNPHRTDI